MSPGGLEGCIKDSSVPSHRNLTLKEKSTGLRGGSLGKKQKPDKKECQEDQGVRLGDTGV